MPARVSRWQPPENVRQHNGDPIPPDADFFAPPPPEIGPILSAQTDLTTDKVPMNLVVSYVLRLIAFGGPIVACYAWSVYRPSFDFAPVMAILLGIGLGAFVVALVVYATQFHFYCHYVGKNGIAIAQCWDHPRLILGRKQLVFGPHVKAMRTTVIRRIINSVEIIGTSLSWYGTGDTPLISVGGDEGAGENAAPPHPLNTIHFTRVAEKLWIDYRLPEYRERFERDGTVEFELRGVGDFGTRGFVDLSKERVRLELGGKLAAVISRDRLVSVTIRNGRVRLNEAKETTAPFEFEFSELADVGIFLLLLQREYGVRIS